MLLDAVGILLISIAAAGTAYVTGTALYWQYTDDQAAPVGTVRDEVTDSD
jgi:hypothetical protein